MAYADFWEALQAYASANLPQLTGGIHADRSDHLTAYPFAVWDQVGESITYNSASESTTEGSLQLTVYAASRATANTLGRLVQTTLKDAPLAFTDGVLVVLRPDNGLIVGMDPDKGPNGIDVWSAVASFRYILSRSA